MNFDSVIRRIPKDSNYLKYTEEQASQSDGVMFSLHDCFAKNRFGFDTVTRTISYLKWFKRNVVGPKSLNIDSSGYSFIKGEIHRLDAMKLIECYAYFIENGHSISDYIFALDLPFNEVYTMYNTKKQVKHFNCISTEKTFEVLNNNPSVVNKFFYIWQFRNMDVYEIWRDIYDNLGIENRKKIKNYAVGGLVGLQKISKKPFAPFIGIAYRILHDFIAAGVDSDVFRIHFLGVNSRRDRFVIILLEKLFSRYLENLKLNSSVEFSYDTIFFVNNGNRNKKQRAYYHFSDNELITYPGIQTLPKDYLREIYSTHTLELFPKEIEHFSRVGNLKCNQSTHALSVFSERQVDCFFENSINNADLVNLIHESHTYERFNSSFSKQILCLSKKYPAVFTKYLMKNLHESLKEVYAFHTCYRNDFQNIEQLVENFIKRIGLSSTLT